MLKLGTYVKYIPGPVILGFTSGIGRSSLVGQVKDFLGLTGDVPADVVREDQGAVGVLRQLQSVRAGGRTATLAAIIGLEPWRPQWPGLLIAVVGASAAVAALALPVETIGSRFGGIPASCRRRRCPTCREP